MRTAILCAAFSLALAGPVRTQTAAYEPDCSSHDHPCRLHLENVTKCQVCHAITQGITGSEVVDAEWAPSAAGNLHFSREAPLRTGSNYLGSHTRMCVSCHDGAFGPRAEQCPSFRMAVRKTMSTTRRMDCGVCHDPHLDNRVEANAKFLHHEENCGDCHEGRLFEEYEKTKSIS